MSLEDGGIDPIRSSYVLVCFGLLAWLGSSVAGMPFMTKARRCFIGMVWSSTWYFRVSVLS